MPPLSNGRFLSRAVGVCVLLTLGAMLREVGALLSRVSEAGAAYGPSVFSGWTTHFPEHADLDHARRTWFPSGSASAGTTDPGTLLSAHLTVDYFFAIVLAIVLWRCIALATNGMVPTRTLFGWDFATAVLKKLPLLYGLADISENIVAKLVFKCWAGACSGPDDAPTTRSGVAIVLHVLTDAKWIFLGASILTLALFFVRAGPTSPISWQRVIRARRDRSSRGLHGLSWGMTALIGLYVILMAVPIDGPLDQTPDLIRGQIDVHGRQMWLAVISLLLLLTLALAAAMLGVAACRPTREVQWWTVLLFGFAMSCGLWALRAWKTDNTPVLSNAAPLIVAVGAVTLSLAAWLTIGSWPASVNRTAVAASAATDRRQRAASSGAVLVGATVLATGIGVVRALTPRLLEDFERFSSTSLGFYGVVLFTCLVAPLVATAVRAKLLPDQASTSTDRAAADRSLVTGAWDLLGCVALASGLFWLVVTIEPAKAADAGALATVILLLCALGSVFVALTAFGHAVSWAQYGNFQRGVRTPWAVLLVATWLVAGTTDDSIGYHDARTLTVSAKHQAPIARDLSKAFASWAGQWDAEHPIPDSCLSPPTRRGRAATLPLVLVAAPGGGAKAAFWTGASMDRVFGNVPVPQGRAGSDQGFCPGSLFAGAGVSGGALGMTTRLSLPPVDAFTHITAAEDASHEGQRASSPTLARMTDDGAVATVLAAMLGRDLLEPLVVAPAAWSDRAAVLEDAWETEAPEAFQQDGRSREFARVGRGWWNDPDEGPVVLLLGSSVSDGCRIVVSNLRAAAGTTDCGLAPPASGQVHRFLGNPISGALDVMDGLLPSAGRGGEAAGVNEGDLCRGTKHYQPDPQTLRASTAALLAARFPYVTPSGAMRRCAGDVPQSTYVVDGGYLENTGLLALMQVWDAVDDLVVMCNDQAAAGAPVESEPGATAQSVGCPLSAGRRIQIEPFLVLLDNHYRLSAAASAPSQPHELFVPIQTNGKKSATLAPFALEQWANAVISRSYGGGITACARFFRVAPRAIPAVQAPLAWALAPSTRDSLVASLEAVFLAEDTGNPRNAGCGSAPASG